MLADVFKSSCLTLFGFEFKAARGFKHGAAAVYNVAHAAQIHIEHLIFDKPPVAAFYSHRSHAVINSGTHNASYAGVHARSVTAACEYTDFLHIHHHSLTIKG